MTQDGEKRANIAKGIAMRFGAIVATLAVQAVLERSVRCPYLLPAT